MYLPVFIFLLNGSFNHVQVVETPMGRNECVAMVESTIQSNGKPPQGLTVRGGCLPLPDESIDAPAAPKEPTKPLKKPAYEI